LSDDRNLIRSIREPDLTRLRDLSRGEAIRIAMLMYGWDAATAATRVDFEQGHSSVEADGGNKRQSAEPEQQSSFQ
jgi:hypothetical protein